MWFEDFRIGARMDLGSYTFTEEEIIRFAKKYDPQPFHIDPEAAKAGPFGGLVASGWHTGATWMKLMIRLRQTTPRPKGDDSPQGGPSPGFFDMRWPNPVRPGDTVTYSAECVERVTLKSRPGWGIVRHRNEGFNQKGEMVFHFIGQGLMPRRAPGEPLDD